MDKPEPTLNELENIVFDKINALRRSLDEITELFPEPSTDSILLAIGAIGVRIWDLDQALWGIRNFNVSHEPENKFPRE